MTEYDYRDPRGYATPAHSQQTAAEPYLTAEPYRLDDRPFADPYRTGDPYRAGTSYQDYRPMAGPGPYPPYPYQAPEHPQGSTVLILGVLSLVFSPLGFAAWYLGSKAQREIAETGATYSNTGNIAAGKIIGMIVSILTIAGGALFLLYMAFMIIMVIGASTIPG